MAPSRRHIEKRNLAVIVIALAFLIVVAVLASCATILGVRFVRLLL